MDRIWQWAWDRYGPKYSWAVWAILGSFTWPVYVAWAGLILALAHAGSYLPAVLAATVVVPVLGYVNVLPGRGWGRVVERWASGEQIDRAAALNATYRWTRGVIVKMVISNGLCLGVVFLAMGLLARTSVSRVIQFAVLGLLVGAAFGLNAVHNVAQTAARPARVAIAGHSNVGDFLPRSRPTFAEWSNTFVLVNMFSYTVLGAIAVAVIGRADVEPLVFVAIGLAAVLLFGAPLAVAVGFSPSMVPIRDLALGTARVAAGDYSRRLPVVQDDDLGALAGSFNRMQAGLAERERLQAAFGTYVDPGLATRLLEQGDDVFTGERREVTVMFVDIRDFTPFAEANTAENTVSRLNALFEIVVPAVVETGGHVNKFLGDGALAVFGAPNDLAGHADAATGAAVSIHRLVAERFGGELRIGIGINTGVVIAGTIGGGGKLEFTLIGDTVNVAARVEQTTKDTGDAILLTKHTVDALAARPLGLVDRGTRALKGKSAAVQIFGLDPTGR